MNSNTLARRFRKAARVWTLLAMWLVGSGTAHAAPYQAPDALITAKAKWSLWTTAGIRSNAVKIDTSEGTVTIYGEVDSASQKQEANKLILGVEGVRHVQDLLQIVAPSNTKKITIADEKIRAQARRAISREPALGQSSISVKSVDNGVVLLTGTAETMSDQILAFLVADSVDGVRRVASEIEAP